MKIWLTSMVLAVAALFYAGAKADAAVVVRAGNVRVVTPGFNRVAFVGHNHNFAFNNRFAVNRFAFNHGHNFAFNRFGFGYNNFGYNNFAFSYPVASYAATYAAPSYAVACPTVAAPITYSAPVCAPAVSYAAAPVCAPVASYGVGYGAGFAAPYGVGFGGYGFGAHNVGYGVGFNRFFGFNHFNTFGNRFAVRTHH